MLKRFDRYFLIEWLKAFAICAMVVVTLLLFERLYDDLEDFLKYEAAFSDIARYFAWSIAGFIPTILPAVLLISALLSLIQSHGRREITSLQAAGLGIFRITRVYWIGAVIAALSIIVMNGWLIPWSVESATHLRENLKHRYLGDKASEARGTGIVKQLTFYNLSEKRLWYFDTFNLRTYSGKNVHLYTFHDDESVASHLSASEAHFDDINQTWTFTGGTILNSTQAPDSEDAENSDFADLYIDKFETWSNPDYQEHPRLMLTLSRRPKDLSILALKELLDSDDLQGSPALAPFYAQYYQFLASPAMCIVIIAIAIPFATQGVRTNPMVGACKAIFRFFIYYMIINTFTVLGGREVLSAQSAAWAPHGIMAAFAVLKNLVRA